MNLSLHRRMLRIKSIFPTALAMERFCGCRLRFGAIARDSEVEALRIATSGNNQNRLEFRLPDNGIKVRKRQDDGTGGNNGTDGVSSGCVPFIPLFSSVPLSSSR